MVVARFRSEGGLDSSFSSDGLGIIDRGGDETGEDLLVQSNGKIVVVGSLYDGDSDWLLVRLLPGGLLDRDFNLTGVVTTDFDAGEFDEARAVLRQSDGKYVVGGNAWGGTEVGLGVGRFLNA
jgi:hypothetical protein